MKALFFTLLSLFLFSYTTFAQAFNSDREQLRYLKEMEWPKAYYEQDTVLLDRILAAEFQMIDAEGNSYTKKDEIAYIQKHKPTYKSFKFDIIRLEVFENNTAVVSGIGTVVNETEDGEEKVMTYSSSNVLIKRGKNWKAIASHVSGIKDE